VAEAVKDLAVIVGEREACARVGYSRSSFRRRHVLVSTGPSRQQRRYEARQTARKEERERRAGRRSSLALSAVERQATLDAVHQLRFIDRSVPYIHATLLDEGSYPCSMSTMYRILHSVGEVGERRDQATRRAQVKPELCATGPRQVFAWDITKLHGPQKWTYYYLYVIIDIYSRYVVGWMVAERESSALARELLAETIVKEGADPSKLIIHADNGSSMASKPVAFLLADLGVTKSHSRPHVSNDNPHIESLFKTVKYQPEFPSTFASLTAARAFCRAFFTWYNLQHRHSSLALLTPSDVHHGRAHEILEQRQRTLNAAYAAHPERFVRGKPNVRDLPTASYINRPQELVVGASEATQPQSNGRDKALAVAATIDELEIGA
jgi:putative transposase